MRYSGEQQRELDRRTGAELDRRAAVVRPRLTPREMYTPEKVARMEIEWKAMEETREKNCSGGMNMTKDDLNKAWLAGYAAYRQGLTKDNSPYKYCSDEDVAWMEGYKAAKFCDVAYG